MSKRITWTHELRVQLYEAVIRVMGTPYENPRGARGKPNGWSKAQYLSVLDDIGVSIGVGGGKGGALSNQIAWITCVPSTNCHQGHWNNRSKNLEAAEEAGYMDGYTKPSTAVLNTNGTMIEISDVQYEQPSLMRRGWNKIKGWFS